MAAARSWPTGLVFVGLVLCGVVLGGYLLCDERTDPRAPAGAGRAGAAAAMAARLSGGGSGRVPRLRLSAPQPGAAAETASRPPAPANPADPIRVRLGPLLSLYDEFEEDTAIGPTTLREMRRLLLVAHQLVLAHGGSGPDDSADPRSREARRERALRELGRVVRAELPAEEADRVLAHPFPRELLGWDEPLFEANGRGLVTVRRELAP